MKIKKGDNVKILLGKDAGKSGKVQRVVGKEGKVVVEGLNIVKRHVKKWGKQEGQILEISKPVDISNVGLICAKCQKVTRVGYKIEDDKKLRFCKKCKEVIANP